MFFFLNSYSQKSYTISGFIKDKDSGELLTGANIYDQDNLANSIFSNAYGFYSLTLKKAEYKIGYSFIGYEKQILDIKLHKDTVVNVTLASGIELRDIVIDAQKQESRQNVSSSQPGVMKLDISKIKELPSLMGETDILKTMQLLPGIKSTGDGSSGFYVRGGGADQNLVLLDEAVVYNTGHMLGFFSIFNADAIKSTKMIKGIMPANYGQRLSSVVDVKMKEGSNKNFAIEGGIGLISSRLTIEGPIVEDKGSFIVSGRRTYILDLVQPFLKGNKFEGTNYYFYDFNAKLNYKLSEKDRFYLSGYFGRDVFNLNFNTRDFNISLPYGNTILTSRWNHVFNNKLFANTSLIYNDYQYELKLEQEKFGFQNYSGIKDWNFKTDFDYFLNSSHFLKFGYNFTNHRLNPSVLNIETENFTLNNGGIPLYANEHSIYVADDWNINKLLLISIGIRATDYIQLGNYTSKIDNKEYGEGDHVCNYLMADPRFSFRYQLTRNSSLKGGISYNSQFLHQVSTSSGAFPDDTWVSSTELVKPESALQYSLGYFQNFNSDNIETSVEIYYKKLNNQIEFREDYVGSIDDDLESKFVFGEGRAYGIEFFVKKNSGKFNGWMSYTLSRTERQFSLINDGDWFKTTYDKPHDFSIVLNYKISEKLIFNTVFVYSSGRRYTPVTDLYILDGKVNLEYGDRNSASYSPYHRLDISLNYNLKSKKKWNSSWSFGIYNVYNRFNPSFISYDTGISGSGGKNKITASKITIFPIIPSITYNFSWNK
jgi:outer membrane receptor for ferrienterochelin and colicin